MNTQINIETFPIGQEIDWKFGLTTRYIYRKNEKFFEITDCSDGWQTAVVSKSTLQSLLNGEESLLNLNWK